MTGKPPLRRGSVSFIQHVGVVVRQFLPRFHFANCLDPDPATVDDRIAVRIARVVDEPRVVSVYSSVDDYIVVDREEVSMVSAGFIVGVTLVGLFRRQPLAGVFDESKAFGYRSSCKRTQSLDLRFQDSERVRHLRTQDYGSNQKGRTSYGNNRKGGTRHEYFI